MEVETRKKAPGRRDYFGVCQLNAPLADCRVDVSFSLYSNFIFTFFGRNFQVSGTRPLT